MKKLFLALALILCMVSPVILASSVMAQFSTFIVGDSTTCEGCRFVNIGNGPSEQWGLIASYDKKTESADVTHFYLVQEGDSLTGFSLMHDDANADGFDSMHVALFTVASGIPDTVCTGTEFSMQLINPSGTADSQHYVPLAISLSPWIGDTVCVVMIAAQTQFGGGQVDTLSALDGHYSQVSRDAVADSSITSPWVELNKTRPMPTSWFEGVSQTPSPVIGYPLIGGTVQADRGQDATANTGNATSGVSYVAKGGGVIDSVYVYASTTTNTESLWVALYEFNGEPDHINWNGRDTVLIPNITTTPGWVGVDVNWPLQKGWTYVLAVGDNEASDLTSDDVDLYYDVGGTEDAEFRSAGTLADPWGTEATNESRLYSFYGKIDTALYQGMIGDSSFADGSITVADQFGLWHGIRSKTYTAIEGDRATHFNVWCESCDSIGFAIYEWDIVGDTPTVVAYMDTLQTTGTGNQYWPKTINYELTAGKVYSAASSPISDDGGDSFHNYKGSSAGSAGDSTGRRIDDGGAYLENPFSTVGNTNQTHAMNFHFLVENFAGHAVYQDTTNANVWETMEINAIKETSGFNDSTKHDISPYVQFQGGYATGAGTYRSILRWFNLHSTTDFTAAEVDSAYFEAYVWYETNTDDEWHSTYEMSVAHQMEPFDALSLISGASWTYRKDSSAAQRAGDTLWATPGGDYTTFQDSTLITGIDGWYRWDISKTLCSLWVADSASNLGLMYRGNDEATTSYKILHSNTYTTDASLRPKLHIYYTRPPRDFFIGDSTRGTTNFRSAVVTEAHAGHTASEGTEHHLYGVQAGDSLTMAFMDYSNGTSGDSIEIGIYTATAGRLPDTLIKSWRYLWPQHNPADTRYVGSWPLNYAFIADNVGDSVMIAYILTYGGGFSNASGDSGDGSFDMSTRDYVSDSSLQQTWVEGTTADGSPTFWFEGVNTGGASVSNILKSKILEGKMPSSPMIGMKYKGPPYDPTSSDAYYTVTTTEVAQ